MDYSQLSPVKPVPLESLDTQQESSPQPKPSFRKTLISILYKIQKYSAYTFLGFLGLHSTTVILLPGLQLPLEICQDSFEMARLVYLGQYFESMILGSLVLHVVSGVSIRYLRRAITNRNGSINHHHNHHYHHNHQHNHKLPDDTVDQSSDDDYNLSTSISQQNANHLVNNQYIDDSHGLGGITSLIGLGSKKSIISNWTGLTPLSFSGYCLIPLIMYHVFKFRWVPAIVDDDNLLVNLQYINVVLNQSLIKWGNKINFVVLLGLIWTSGYHFTSGILKFNGKFLDYYKKLGYGILTGISVLGFMSLTRFKYFKFDNGYMMNKFMNYITYSRI